MDTKLKRIKPREERLPTRQQQERERLVRMKRIERSMPITLPPRPRSPRPRFGSPRPRSRSPPVKGGISKKKQETLRNENGRIWAVRKGDSTRAKSCSKVVTFPQEGATCWFGALFTSFFFSQYSRVVIRGHATRLMSDQGSRHIASAILEIIRGYEGDRVSPRVLESMRPRQFLRDLRIARPDYFSTMQDGSDEAMYAPYQHAMLAFLRVPHLSLGIVRGKFVYSAFNVDLPVDWVLWPGAMKTLPSRGVFVDTRHPEVLLLHKDNNEDYAQSLWTTPTPAVGAVEGYDPTKHAPVIKYNGRRYILDSCIIPAELKTDSCGMGHAIAGVTCNGDRYVYNGWTARTADPAMKGYAGAAIRDAPCSLGKQDWADDAFFRINMQACSFNRATPTGKEFMFNAVDKSSVVYIRHDLVQKAIYKKLGRQVKKRVFAKLP